jgi:hypothetical protein
MPLSRTTGLSLSWYLALYYSFVVAFSQHVMASATGGPLWQEQQGHRRNNNAYINLGNRWQPQHGKLDHHGTAFKGNYDGNRRPVGEELLTGPRNVQANSQRLSTQGGKN